ncbi:MAG: polysaccharide deacetylase family protein [Flavobacteriales bacterium]|nr:polysaccharide deacetylase family protein [Flavobacteriales bacterium]
MILIYSHKLTNRLKYIFTTIFKDVLLTPVEFTQDPETFKQHPDVKINYTSKNLGSGLFFQSSTLLFENGITEQNISVFKHEEYPCFFAVSKESALPFDPFAASFYLISRYEEYLPHIRDEHERFNAMESLAYKHRFLQLPLVNIWINQIEQIIRKAYPEFNFPERKFQFISTIDIDNAYAYKHKGNLRAFGGLIKGIKEGTFAKRIRVLMGKEHDPYDTFDYQNQIHKKHNISPVYFILLGDYGVNDKNIPVNNRAFQSLIKSLADYTTVGIHPSYASNSSNEQLTKEIKRLQDITHRNTTKSRQHFLKLVLPVTYRNLIENDIEEDYTMGYADHCGFRASICSPYQFYDLDTESITNLTIIPFTVMEATFQYYQNGSPEEVRQQIHELMQKVKDVKGTFVSVWHNESLSDEGIWKGWKNVYEFMLEEAGL